MCGEIGWCVFPGSQLRPCGCRDHGGIVRRKRQRRKADRKSASPRFGGEGDAEFTVGCDSTGDENAGGAIVLGCGEGAPLQIFDDSVLEGRNQVKRLLVAERQGICRPWGSDGLQCVATRIDRSLHAVHLDIAQHSSLDAAEREESLGGKSILPGFHIVFGDLAEMRFRLDLREGERNGARIAVGRQCIDEGTAGIGQAEQLRNLVEGFACCVVDGAANVAIAPGCVLLARREIEMRMATGDDQGECRKRKRIFVNQRLLEQNCVDVAFQMVDGDERLVERERQSLGIGNADVQGARESGAFSDSDRSKIGKGDTGFVECRLDNGHDVAQMFAGSQLRNHATPGSMRGELRGHDAGTLVVAACDHGSRGFITGTFDAEDETCAEVVWLRRVAERNLVHFLIIEVWSVMGVTATDANTQTVTGPRMAATAIVRKLRDAGYQAYFAGGCVRDLLLGRAALDYDVATNARPDTVLELFPKTYAVGAHFGVVLVCSEVEGTETVTEVATFRHDGVYSDGRHPDAVQFSDSAEEDVRRRDFTINGMLLDPLQEGDAALLDYVGGRNDLAAGIVRAIGDPARRFEEDKLRMLRAVRFAARFDFEIEPATLTAIRKLAGKIGQVSQERIRDELTRMLTEGRAAQAFELLDVTGLLVHILPEVARMKGVAQPPEYHPEGDVWVHTLLLLEKLEAGASPTLAWGTLLHDVGKPPTYREAPDRIRFDGHAEVGTRMTEAILKRLRFLQ